MQYDAKTAFLLQYAREPLFRFILNIKNILMGKDLWLMDGRPPPIGLY
jgi:hypothetical protein